MEHLLSQAKRVAASDASVCIFGASGTGKELLARDPPREPRAAEAFVAVNCGAIPRACSSPSCSATRRARSPARCRPPRPVPGRAGRHPVPGRDRRHAAALQVKLLRALEERKVRRWARENRSPSMCAIAATHRKLEERIASGRVPRGPLYRLNVVKLYIPTLAERREDIPLLANAFLSRLASATGAAAHLVARGAWSCWSRRHGRATCASC